MKKFLTGMLAGADLEIGGFLHNLFWVTLGNIVGGAGGVALVYWTIYLRPAVRVAAIADPAKPSIAAGDNGR